ncbi:hypothetical protein [Lentzea sp. CC55]|uniref:hypothetical protein n=1 Tax=Lentzea sp. CC55 TaxID=2884909 RepID=UPI001F20F20B|nr:hypothetical protein [Lentzea sp. CC55]MCG8928240.1 hypothetical protein [Lentzea sp. CC55]
MIDGVRSEWVAVTDRGRTADCASQVGSSTSFPPPAAIAGHRPRARGRPDVAPGEHDGSAQWTSAVVVFDGDRNPHVEAVGPFPGEKNNIGPPVFHVARAVFAEAALLVPAGFLAVHFLRFVFLW